MIHLHVHSTFSFLDGYGTPEQMVARVKKIKQKALAITDHGNVCGWIPFHTQCNKAGIKPILGVEAYVVNEYIKEEPYRHVILLAQNLKGYYNIIKLVSKSYTDGFYKKPRMLWKDIYKYNEGVILSSACVGGYLGILWDKYFPKEIRQLKAQKWILETKKAFGKRFFIEIMPNNFIIKNKGGKKIFNQTEYNTKVIKLAQQFKVPMIATIDAHYPDPKDDDAQDMMYAIGQKKTMFDLARRSYKGFTIALITGKDMFRLFRKNNNKQSAMIKNAIRNTDKVANLIKNFDLPKIGLVKFPTKNKTTKEEFLYQVRKGIRKRGIPKTKTYMRRLKKETGLIIKKGFDNYFLIVSDMIRWAKRRGILIGPARGSSAGSLVSYILDITEVDPIKHGLLFERFIDETRTDYPDIDIDIENVRRDEMVNYLKNKYGQEHVANLATYAYFKGRNSIQDIGRIYKIPFTQTQLVSEHIIVRSQADARASLTILDTIAQDEKVNAIVKKYPKLAMAAKLEGQIRQASTHACAVMLSDVNMYHNAAIMKDRKGNEVLQMNYDQTKHINMLKIDLLRLNTLSVLSATNRLIKKYHDTVIDYYNLPLDDEKTLALFTKADTRSIFQMEGRACTSVCGQLHPTTFEEVSHLNAMARPGPLRSGQTQKYFKAVAAGKPFMIHPAVYPYTKETQGILLFQEQIMQIVREIGLFDWKDTHGIRKVMAGSQGIEFFNTFQKKFIKGAKESKGLKEKEARKIWGNLCTFGAWAFNKSHSVSYSYISYWCAYAKAHYPFCFMAAVASTAQKDEKIADALLMFKNVGGKLLPPSIKAPMQTFCLVKKNKIRIGLQDIKGIGSKAAQEIIDQSPYKNKADFLERITKRTVNSRVVKLLEEIGFFKRNKKQIELSEYKFYPWLTIQRISRIRESTSNAASIQEILESYEKGEAICLPCYLDHINFGDASKEAGRAAYGRKGKYVTIWMKDDTSQLVGTTFDDSVITKYYSLLTELKKNDIVLVYGRKIKGALIEINRIKKCD